MFLWLLTMVRVWRVFSAQATGEHATFHFWRFQSRDDHVGRENKSVDLKAKASYTVKVSTPTVPARETVSAAISAQRLMESGQVGRL